MAKRKFYYVLVFTNEGAVYVTKVDNTNKVSYWNKDKEPKALNSTVADDICIGLLLNGFNAVVVRSPIEVLHQPYNYEKYECTFIEKEDGVK